MKGRLRTYRRRILNRAPLPRLLLLVAGANCAVVFVLLVAYGSPGLGLGQGFYLSVVLAALVSGPLGGAAAGAVAVGLYVIALLLGGELGWDGVVSEANGIRLASYVAAGAAVGYVAKRGRSLLTEALGSLETLLALAGRDLTTAALAGDGLRRSVDGHLARGEPFSLLVVDVAETTKLAVAEWHARRVSALIRGAFGGDEELARIGTNSFSVFSAAVDRLHARRAEPEAPGQAALGALG
jgi:hypothetical protein